RLYVLRGDLPIYGARVGIDIDSEELGVRGKRGVVVVVGRRDPAGEEERAVQLVGERSHDRGVDRLSGAPNATVVGDDVEQEHVDARLLVGAQQGGLNALASL